MPFMPGSYVPEPPHRRLARTIGESLHGLMHPAAALPGGLPGPSVCETWLRRPYSATSFAGVVFGSELIEDWVEQRQGYFAGYRLGEDLDEFWGVETRIAFSYVRLDDSPQAKAAQQAADNAAGVAIDDPYRNRFDQGREADFFLWDVDLLYYPWGDRPLRPYGMIGFGLMRVSFVDRLNRSIEDLMYSMPLAIGIKHRPTERAAFRLEVADNIGFGGDLDMLHNVSLTLGFELRFGGSRKAYWPWNPGRYYW